MQLLNNNQVQLMENLIQINQNSIKKTLSQYLKSKYKRVVETKDYLYAIGNIPIALVAHMDTVFESYHGERNVYYDRRKNVMSSSQLKKKRDVWVLINSAVLPVHLMIYVT